MSACFAAQPQTYGISTFAGGAIPTNIAATSTSASAPQAVAVDAVGDIFFADFYSDILRVDAVTGALTVVAGNGTPGFSGDNGLATNAQLNQPAGIAVDLAGNLYIADTLNNRIRRVSHGVISTIAGDGTTAAMNMPLGVAMDISGNVYVADSGNNRVLEISQGTITTVAMLSPSIGCVGVAVSPNGTLYVSGGVNVYQLNDGVLNWVSQNPPPAHFEPAGIAVDANGRVYVADVGNHEIWEISNGTMTPAAGDGKLGYSGDGGPATLAELNWAEDVAVDAADNLYIADFMNNRIRKVTLGVITTVAGNGTVGFVGNGGAASGAQSNLPEGVAVDGAGNVYIADAGSNRVFEVSHGAITVVAGNGTAGFSGDGGAATSAQLNRPQGVAVDGSGNVFITDSGNNRIREVTKGVITTVAGNGTDGFGGDGGPAAAGQLNAPQGGLAVDSNGNVYIADTFNSRIREVSNGVITTIAGNGRFGFSGDGGPAVDASLNGPVGVAVDSSGNLYIADTGYPIDGVGRIRKVSNGIISTVAGAGLDPTPGNLGDNGPAIAAALGFPKSVAVDSLGNLYIADAGGPTPGSGGDYARVRKVSNGVITTIAGNGTAGFTGDSGPGSEAALNVPQGLAVDGAGNVYVADSGSNALFGSNDIHSANTGDNRVRVLTPNPAPAISPGGIVPNDGSIAVIQAGSWISIYGSDLANGTYLWNADFPLSLGDTSVTIDGRQAYLWFVSPTQINAQAPDDMATGLVSVVVTTPFGTVNSTVTLAAYAPSFTLLDDGKHVAGEIVSLNGTGAYDFGYYDLVGPVNTFSFATRPVNPGEMLTLFGVGFGPTTPSVPAGVTFSGAAPATSPVTITIGGIAARVIFQGITAAGLYQFNVIVPNVGSGDQLVQATVNGVQTPAGAVVTVQ